MTHKRIIKFAWEAGYSYLEMVAAVGIVSILVAIAINKFAGLQVDAERTAVESTVGALRSALGIKVAELISKSDVAGVRALAGSNPMDRLAEQPKNYLGTVNADNPGDIERGKWYFDTVSQTLVYRVINDMNFAGSIGTPARMRFQVRLVFTDSNGNKVFDPGMDAVEGVRLTAMEPYRWIE